MSIRSCCPTSGAKTPRALVDAFPNDTIILAPGIYHQGLVINVPNITLKGEPGAHLMGVPVEGKAALVVRADGVVIDGVPQETEPLRGVLVSTMEQQFLGLHPYWGEGPGPLRYSSVAYAPRHFLRAALPLMRGKPNRFVRPEFGYWSVNASRVEMHLDSGFILDGELFTPETGTPVLLSAEHSAFFLRRGSGSAITFSVKSKIRAPRPHPAPFPKP